MSTSAEQMKIPVRHLRTQFLFPFSIDQEAVMEDHAEIWRRKENWFEHLDEWVTRHTSTTARVLNRLGRWKRMPYAAFDFTTPAYQDMLFFHPFVRRIFFDTGGHDGNQEALLRCYALDSAAGRLWVEAEERHGERVLVELPDIRLFLFANGIGILSLDVAANWMPFGQALWINEMLRKVYPSSDRQVQSGRIPSRLALVLERGGERHTLVEEKWDDCKLRGIRPPLSKLLTELLGFADYDKEEFEPVLDERMVVNTLTVLDKEGCPADYQYSEQFDAMLSRLLYVDRDGEGYRYESGFTCDEMSKSLYRRWQHEGTVYGTTAYSQITVSMVEPEVTDEQLQRSLVPRKFGSKNSLISLIALFYRASLLNYAKETALVSRQLFPIFTGQMVRHRHIQLATRLMADFHYFDNYWFFSELTPKDEESEYFRMLCDAYRIAPMRQEMTQKVANLAGYIDRLYSLRNNDAVNRLALLSMALGLGALVTGYYGMNIPHLTSVLSRQDFSRVSFVATLLMTVASLALIAYIVVSNWIDYRSSLVPHHLRRSMPRRSLQRIARGYSAGDGVPTA